MRLTGLLDTLSLLHYCGPLGSSAKMKGRLSGQLRSLRNKRVSARIIVMSAELDTSLAKRIRWMLGTIFQGWNQEAKGRPQIWKGSSFKLLAASSPG